MRVLVISDTHIPVASSDIPSIIEEEAKKSDYCLHAGDFISYSVFEKLASWTKTYGVKGNMDDREVCQRLPTKQIIELEKIRIGLIHGEGAPRNLITYVNSEFIKELDTIDIFVFGHSHYPTDTVVKGKIYFNAGSPTDRIFTPYVSYGILEIQGNVIKKRIVKIG